CFGVLVEFKLVGGRKLPIDRGASRCAGFAFDARRFQTDLIVQGKRLDLLGFASDLGLAAGSFAAAAPAPASPSWFIDGVSSATPDVGLRQFRGGFGTRGPLTFGKRPIEARRQPQVAFEFTGDRRPGPLAFTGDRRPGPLATRHVAALTGSTMRP